MFDLYIFKVPIYPGGSHEIFWQEEVTSEKNLSSFDRQ